MKKFPLLKNTAYGGVVILFMILFGCSPKPIEWVPSSQQQVITDYVAANADQYSEFGKLLEAANLNSLLSVRGPFTLFLPTNEAMTNYYKEHNTSFEQLNPEDMKRLVYNHLVVNELQSSDFGLGALRDTNAH
ncbi:MAG TPA: hypothetical protein DCL77_09385, partial [Prolixibacteraceae bacterium]|nr:hypothetical protein [Prolixibacteraceae bacterium]